MLETRRSRPHEPRLGNLTLSSLVRLASAVKVGRAGVAVLNCSLGCAQRQRQNLSGEKGRYCNEPEFIVRKKLVHSNPQITKFSGWVIKKVIDTEGPCSHKVASSGRKRPNKASFLREKGSDSPHPLPSGPCLAQTSRAPPFTPQSSHPGISGCKLPTRKAVPWGTCRGGLCPGDESMQMLLNQKVNQKKMGSLQDEVVVICLSAVSATRQGWWQRGGCQENRLRRLPPRQLSREESLLPRCGGLMEQEVVLHVPLKRVIIPIKQEVVQGERWGERWRRERKNVFHNIW